MKTWLATLAAGLALIASAGTALAQSSQPGATPPLSVVKTVPPATPPLSQATAPQPHGLPNVESADILKQNQAERTQLQPGNLAPTYRLALEGTDNFVNIPALEAGVLIQPKTKFLGQSRDTTAGEAWREYRNGPLTLYGGWLIVLVFVGIAAFYLIFGPLRVKGPRTGRLIERFTAIERIAHWTTAITFVTLALTGLTMLFGKHVVLPVFGHVVFGWLAYLCKNVHNFVGPLFSLSLIVTFAIFVKDNFPALIDFQWIRALGGARGHAPAGRFNAGEKLWFWGGVVFLGIIVSASGFVLNEIVPGILYTRGNMQLANVIHLIAAVLIFCASLGHIYMGTIGMEGAYRAMREGYVDDEWAREHHDRWYEDIQTGKVPRVRTQEGASEIGVSGKAAQEGA
ncbi:MAG TPA: formate dehydrogenase subunit gamma [Oxalicibacterium sp.]|nr:formate dehydrogenase subunit gamma [Oxalicibacterium sp.]